MAHQLRAPYPPDALARTTLDLLAADASGHLLRGVRQHGNPQPEHIRQ
jgi:hypothetical protein